MILDLIKKTNGDLIGIVLFILIIVNSLTSVISHTEKCSTSSDPVVLVAFTWN